MTYETYIYMEGFGAGMVVTFILVLFLFSQATATSMFKVRFASLWRKQLWTSSGEKVWVIKAVTEGVRVIDYKGRDTFWSWDQAVEKLTGKDKTWAESFVEAQVALKQAESEL